MLVPIELKIEEMVMNIVMVSTCRDLLGVLIMITGLVFSTIFSNLASIIVNISYCMCVCSLWRRVGAFCSQPL